MIPIWRRYQRPLVLSILCAGLVALIVGNTVGFWRWQKTADTPAPSAVTDTTDEIPADTGTKQGEHQVVSPRPQVVKYTVAPGDTLEGIAWKYAIDVETIMGANPELNGDLIFPGQLLNILAEKGVLHTVKAGETIWSIARQYGLDWQKVHADNAAIDAEALQPGQKLFIRGAKPLSKGDEFRESNEGNVSRGNIDAAFAWPAHGFISSPFGYRWGALHAGIDIAADNGTGIYAARGGQVSYAGWKDGYGLAVVLNHGRGWETLYGHASELYVTTGDIIQGGQCIAAVGNTGYSTGPHVHFEIHYQGIPQNPVRYLP